MDESFQPGEKRSVENCIRIKIGVVSLDGSFYARINIKIRAPYKNFEIENLN